jgi:hypothetical protein
MAGAVIALPIPQPCQFLLICLSSQSVPQSEPEDPEVGTGSANQHRHTVPHPVRSSGRTLKWAPGAPRG